MQSEDYALLIGSVGAVALAMVVTRNLDWYGAPADYARM